MKFRFKLFLAIAVVGIGQISNIIPLNAQSAELGKLVSQERLASSILGAKSIGASENPAAKELLARSRKPRTSTINRKPAAKPGDD